MFKVYLMAVLFSFSIQTFAQTSYNITPRSIRSITAFNVCKTLTSSSPDKTYIVPTGLASDWQEFLTHAPADIAISNCPPVNCAGTWSACSKSCGGGKRTFTITQAPQNGGTACPASPQDCNTQSCCFGSGHLVSGAQPMGSTSCPLGGSLKGFRVSSKDHVSPGAIGSSECCSGAIFYEYWQCHSGDTSLHYYRYCN